MDLGLEGKRALVLGGRQGLGRGVAEALAAEGVIVALLSRNSEGLAQTALEIGNQAGVRAIAVGADLSDHASVVRAVATVNEEIGGIDILINNSGGPPPSGASGVAPEVWRAQFETMILSIIEITDLVLTGMREQRWGRILTIASSGVVEPNPLIGVSNALRSTLVGWSKTLAGEVASHGVTANILLPGWIATERLREIDLAAAGAGGSSVDAASAANLARIPVGRYGTIQEFGAVAAFLASDLASYVTGSMIRVDGGAIRSV